VPESVGGSRGDKLLPRLFAQAATAARLDNGGDGGEGVNVERECLLAVAVLVAGDPWQGGKGAGRAIVVITLDREQVRAEGVDRARGTGDLVHPRVFPILRGLIKVDLVIAAKAGFQVDASQGRLC
jgi:hypothetical protein